MRHLHRSRWRRPCSSSSPASPIAQIPQWATDLGPVLLGMDGLLAGGPVGGRDAVLEFVEDVRAELVDSGVITDAR